jgi:NADPH2 dehydrogenase
VVDAVHAKGCHIFCQLFAPGRAGALPGLPLYSSTAVPLEDGASVPEEMTEPETSECFSDFREAAANAMVAGFDGVELHSAHGYLIDQFIQDTCNKRSDSWGGPCENRSQFALELTKAVAQVVGADRTAIRLSPWSVSQGMKMSTFLYSAAEQWVHQLSFQQSVFGAAECKSEMRGTARTNGMLIQDALVIIVFWVLT